MSFTAPQTYYSLANTGQGSIIEIGTGSPVTYAAAITEVKSITRDAMSMAEIDVTHLLSPGNTAEYIPGLIKPGKMSFSGNLNADATQVSIETHAQARDILNLRLTAPVQRLGKTLVVTGQGFFSNYKEGPYESDKAIEFTADMQMTGLWTKTVL